MTRRNVIVTAPASAAALLAQTSATTAPAPLTPQDSQLVKDWVSKAHQRKLEPMKEMLQREPNLIHASWDWGGGDWESGLQAAAHTGSQEMARFLLAEGARLDLFAAAMLGELSYVKVSLEVFPGSFRVRGAHGIPLLSHAAAGGTVPVIEFLLAKGADVNAVHNNGMTALQLAVGGGSRDVVRLLLGKGANPNAKAKNGNTALSMSVKANKPEISADLKAAGATE